MKVEITNGPVFTTYPYLGKARDGLGEVVLYITEDSDGEVVYTVIATIGGQTSPLGYTTTGPWASHITPFEGSITLANG